MPKKIADENIFQAAIQLLGEQGYSGATTREIAETARVSEMTLFRRFGSKSQLIRSAVEWIITEADIEQASVYTGNLRADLHRITAAYRYAADQYGLQITVLLAELPRYPELAEVIDFPYGVFRQIAELLERYMAAGELRQEPALNTLAALLGPLMFSSLLRKSIPDVQPDRVDLEGHLQGFLKGRIPAEQTN